MTSDPSVASGTARSPLELFAVAMAFTIPIAYAPGLEGQAWSARSALLMLVVAVGVPVLLRHAWTERSLATTSAVAFLAVGTASAALSHNPTTAVFGLYNQGTGLLFMASLAGAWAIGTRVGPQARPLLEAALIAGVLANAAVAVLSALLVPRSSVASSWFDLGGRAQALAGNPVHLAALAVLALPLIVPHFATSGLRWALPVAALCAAVELSGTRLALVAMLAILVWSARRHGMWVACLLAATVVLGLAAGAAIVPTGSVSATQRATSTDNWRTRPATWLSASHSIAKHPLLGVGPGQFRSATSPYRPTSVALSEGADKLFTDAHNLFVEYATTTGILGLVTLSLWLVAAILPARGWLLVGALGVLAIHIAEPQSVVTTPLMFLALGAANSATCCGVAAANGTGLSDQRQPRTLSRRVLAAACIAVALGAAAVFLVGEFDLAQGQLDLVASPVEQADRLLPAWPRSASLLARVYLFEGITGHRNGPEYQESRTWRLAAIQRDDRDPALWNDLAEYDASRDRNIDAKAEFLTALHFNPTSVRALDGLARLAQAGCDTKQAALWHQRSLRVTPTISAPPSTTTPTATLPPACIGRNA